MSCMNHVPSPESIPRSRPSRSSSKRAKNMVHEVSAGGLVFKRTPKGILFAMMKDSYGKWTFPKGHVESGEEKEEAAARESMEELGLEQIRLLESLGQITIWFRDRFVKKGALVHKDIHYFLFATLPDTELFPQTSEHIQEAAWIPAKELLERSFYPDLVPVIKRALMYVRIHGGTV
ncbi:MAG: hypothetical protein UU48_C0006G0119 [Candidatus Uhrbacteria bacterium GW2011_GWF2_41_16]|uniref:Nudix hydrolase domain-containing protein n=2 Tax=Candidatus Uhriibacteriota TaxID=1752732 RepID=A0A0G0VAY9_9BACT|nr:MAG: hypothetical protein UU35_C0007G0013 [Candidatus Uhrbacteria bacterium GW2011_GWC2_41_11]KKR98079.1 MAG: hypothetical protein UU48_C0006G0119 [Candidatus Uhrbacteria bacterium GW2011_GWF2_41_16]